VYEFDGTKLCTSKGLEFMIFQVISLQYTAMRTEYVALTFGIHDAVACLFVKQVFPNIN
jgi:hypothetical protein